MKRVSIVFGVFFVSALSGDQNPIDLNFSLHHYKESEIQYAFLFAHGLYANQDQAKRFMHYPGKNEDGSVITNDLWIFDNPVITFDFPDAKTAQAAYARKFVSLSQELDIERLAQAVTQAQEHLPSTGSIVGAGLSRGSSTWFTYLAAHKPKNIGALILESPFDHLKNIVEHLLKRYRVNWLPFSTKVGMWLSKMNFPAVSLSGAFPIDVINQIPLNIPILLVHSKADKVIPINSSRRLYFWLRQAGHNHVYLLELDQGDHGKLMQSPEALKYVMVAHAFLKKYRFPHDKEWAKKGESLLALCQPPLADVSKKIKRSIFPHDEMYDLEGNRLENFGDFMTFTEYDLLDDE